MMPLSLWPTIEGCALGGERGGEGGGEGERHLLHEDAPEPKPEGPHEAGDRAGHDVPPVGIEPSVVQHLAPSGVC